MSDNNAYNYLFDFFRQRLCKWATEQIRGMQPAHLNHKFLYGADNGHTWKFKFYNEENELTYEQGSITSYVDKTWLTS